MDLNRNFLCDSRPEAEIKCLGVSLYQLNSTTASLFVRASDKERRSRVYFLCERAGQEQPQML